MGNFGSLIRSIIQAVDPETVESLDLFSENVLIVRKLTPGGSFIAHILNRDEAEEAYQSHLEFLDSVGDDLIDHLNGVNLKANDLTEPDDMLDRLREKRQVEAEVIQKLNQKVYLVRQGTEYKIGVARDPQRRMSGIAAPTCKSYPKELILTMTNDDPLALERHLHMVFKHKQVSGEWFALSDLDIEWIKSSADLFGAMKFNRF